MSILCLGDPLVDLIREGQEAYVPHPGGVMANVAVAAARAGARVALAGDVGEDRWGDWLRARLVADGIDDGPLHSRAGATPIALVTVEPAGDASYALYGEADTPWWAEDGALESALAAADGLCVGSNTLVAQRARAATVAAVRESVSAGRPVVFDPNLRLHRWRSVTDAAATANQCVRGALLVRCNAAEAEVLTGERDVERAAVALLKTGAQNVVISRGAGGALLRGQLRADVPSAPVRELRSTVGAGDVLTGVLLARLSLSGWYAPAIAAALPRAVAAAAVACERWGALD